ncbi:MAG: Dot/Icm secretion system protein IcmQ [Legionellaceae bacterium]|nr:Dot/Icm secretion system protein IcmQ [Legionellaceae bacterium]
MKPDLNEGQIHALKEALDQAISDGPWQESNFLRVIGKNLEDIRDTFVAEVEHHTASQVRTDANLAHRVALRSGQREIYVSLYTSEGDKLASWERILSNLMRQVTSRPIYADEQEVRKLIRGKDNPVNEAYVAVYVNQDDILELSPERTSHDRYGVPLIALKDRAIVATNISRFVHRSGVYQYEQGHLKKSSAESSEL